MIIDLRWETTCAGISGILTEERNKIWGNNYYNAEFHTRHICDFRISKVLN